MQSRNVSRISNNNILNNLRHYGMYVPPKNILYQLQIEKIFHDKNITCRVFF